MEFRINSGLVLPRRLEIHQRGYTRLDAAWGERKWAVAKPRIAGKTSGFARMPPALIPGWLRDWRRSDKHRKTDTKQPSACIRLPASLTPRKSQLASLLLRWASSQA